MKPKDKATELIEKLGSKSISQVENTLEIWEIKLRHAKKDNCENGINICLRTLKYWNKVKFIINGIHILQ
jgi:hypothetical protein